MGPRVAIVLWMAAASCAPVDVETLRFYCGSDAECIDGWVCDPVDEVCVPAGTEKDAGFEDAGDGGLTPHPG